MDGSGFCQGRRNVPVLDRTTEAVLVLLGQRYPETAFDSFFHRFCVWQCPDIPLESIVLVVGKE